MRHHRRAGLAAASIAGVLIVCGAASACGKKGPPLPPLVKVPSAPLEFAAERRGARVDLQFTVPNANTDNSRPANVSRVDVYAVTSPQQSSALTDDELLKQGTKVASVPVKAPRDPDQTVEADESDADMETPEGTGLDQGARAHATEELTGPALIPPAAKNKKDATRRSSEADRRLETPLLPPPPFVPSRIYIAFGITPRGRKGPLSKRAAVPLIPPPPPPASPTFTYDERAATVTWPPAPAVLSGAARPGPGAGEGGADRELPSSPIGVPSPTIAYNVYDAGSSTKLTSIPVSGTEFSDPRIVWGERRCYTVRTVETIGELSVESEAPAATCATLVDTFPPAAPANLQSSPGEGAINLIWDPNSEKDLAGYLVFRGVPPGDALEQITPALIQESTFRDAVPAGMVYVYAVKAVDKAGNASPLSTHVQEVAR